MRTKSDDQIAKWLAMITGPGSTVRDYTGLYRKPLADLGVKSIGGQSQPTKMTDHVIAHAAATWCPGVLRFLCSMAKKSVLIVFGLESDADLKGLDTKRYSFRVHPFTTMLVVRIRRRDGRRREAGRRDVPGGDRDGQGEPRLRKGADQRGDVGRQEGRAAEHAELHREGHGHAAGPGRHTPRGGGGSQGNPGGQGQARRGTVRSSAAVQLLRMTVPGVADAMDGRLLPALNWFGMGFLCLACPVLAIPLWLWFVSMEARP